MGERQGEFRGGSGGVESAIDWSKMSEDQVECVVRWSLEEHK
jgi:hypothetical protein